MSNAISLNPHAMALPMNRDTAGKEMIADKAALFETVFKDNFKSLHSYASSIIKDEAAAEELVQGIFLKLWERSVTLPATLSVVAYLYKSVYNESLNYIKHNKVKDKYRRHAINTGNIYEESDPAAVRQLQQQIDKALNELPEQCRTVFQLSRHEDLSYRAIAHRLGISVKTVEGHMGKALRLLRTRLAPFLPLLLLFINVKNLLP